MYWKSFVILWTITVPSIVIAKTSNTFSPLSDEIIREINQRTQNWKAGRNFQPETTEKYIQALLGTFEEPSYMKLPQQKPHKLRGLQIPTSFDPREKWPNCPSLNEIRDQAGCGSCWAISAVEAMTDRLCIASKGKERFRFSVENLLACCSTGHFWPCSIGCMGGFPSNAWRHWKNNGIVSGGPYGSHEGCQPYEYKPCSAGASAEPCEIHYFKPKCTRKCDPTYNVSYTEDLHFGKDAYMLSDNVTQIQIEIMKNGPVVAQFKVYDDFMSYKSGVYHYVTGSIMGSHAVKLMGWGEDAETGVPYWLAANSWNYGWGEGGFFRIVRGQNECGIESMVTAGTPKVN